LSLKKRLEQIESDCFPQAKFCGCFMEFVRAELNHIYHDVPNEIDSSTLPDDFCQRCKKPVNTELIQSLMNDVKRAYGTYESAELVD